MLSPPAGSGSEGRLPLPLEEHMNGIQAVCGSPPLISTIEKERYHAVPFFCLRGPVKAALWATAQKDRKGFLSKIFLNLFETS